MTQGSLLARHCPLRGHPCTCPHLNKGTKHILYGVEYQWKEDIDSGHFQHFNPYLFVSFSCHIFHLINVGVHFLRGRGFEKVYVLYTGLNIDNYGRPLTELDSCVRSDMPCGVAVRLNPRTALFC